MSQPAGQLKRQIGLFHAVLLGLGSILGTGVFVSIGIAAGIAGPAVLIAIVLAAMLALCNGLSSAQLAAAHPVAGGTYEYGYKYLNDKLGFIAGWMFLCAKSASAATAALGVAGQLLVFSYSEIHGAVWIIAAPIAVLLLTWLVCFGIKRSSTVNTAIVAITVIGLICFIVSATSAMVDLKVVGWAFDISSERMLLEPVLAATALMFVAFTGYGRIATLGEEVHSPRKTIPRAIFVTLGVSTLLYCGIGLSVGFTLPLMNVSADSSALLSPLEVTAISLGLPAWVKWTVSIAAITAMLGVLLNLILGLSRVVLAMGRRGDMPRVFAKVNASGTTPVPAVLLVSGIIIGLTLIGDIKATWSFAAFTVLIYYSITNLACLKLPQEDRLYPRAFAWAGLLGCLFLAWWVEPIYWGAGLIVMGIGLAWHLYAQRFLKKIPDPRDVCAQCEYDLRASVGHCPECGLAIPEDDARATPQVK